MYRFPITNKWELGIVEDGKSTEELPTLEGGSMLKTKDAKNSFLDVSKTRSSVQSASTALDLKSLSVAVGHWTFDKRWSDESSFFRATKSKI